MNEGDAVYVLMGDGLPVGARVLGAGDPCWLDVNIMGQHLPQQYRPTEVQALDPQVARASGLCSTCLGYGTTGANPPPATSIDQLEDPCEDCGGSGRSALRVTIRRDPGETVGSITVKLHDPVPGDRGF